jgi:hypothetical protein
VLTGTGLLLGGAYQVLQTFAPHFVAVATATGFVLLNLLCNGLTLRKFALWLGIEAKTPKPSHKPSITQR